MDQQTENKLINFFNLHKVKLYISIFFFLILVVVAIFKNQNDKEKNIIISEKYVQAGLYLASNEKEKALKIYQDIIESNNKFYSILALNNIIEKSLITNKNEILGHFTVIEKKTASDEIIDLVIFKKALYLIKNSDAQKGKKLLNELVEKNSNFKKLAEEILN